MDERDPAPRIHFTTDGAVPTLDSPVYTVPLYLTETTTLRYFAVDDAGLELGPYRMESRGAEFRDGRVAVGSRDDLQALGGAFR